MVGKDEYSPAYERAKGIKIFLCCFAGATQCLVCTLKVIGTTEGKKFPFQWEQTVSDTGNL